MNKPIVPSLMLTLFLISSGSSQEANASWGGRDGGASDTISTSTSGGWRDRWDTSTTSTLTTDTDTDTTSTPTTNTNTTSTSTSTSTPTTGTANLLFKSGFEQGVSIGEPYTNGPGSWWQDIQGSDNPDFSWPIKLWGTAGTFQVLVDPQSNPTEYIQNKIETVTGHDGQPTRALFSKILKEDGGATQDPYILDNANENGDMYVKYWLKFPDNLADTLGSWATFFEWKTTQDYKIAAYIAKEGGTPYWIVHGHNGTGGSDILWTTTDKKTPVPAGEWFPVEFFWHRSTGNDGRFWMAVNGQVVSDYHGPNKLSDPINRVMLFTVYGDSYPFSQWVDDVEIWDGFPCGEGKSCH